MAAACIVLLFMPMVLCADRIVLKDGTVEESDKVWESEGYVHFILKGTNSVEIRYDKEIVDRIEPQDKLPKQPAAAPPSSSTHRLEIKTTKPEKELTVESGVGTAPTLSKKDLQVIIRNSRGMNFYDPRRTNRYWASKESQHKDLKGALEAVAKLYGRSPQWVERHMGEENDLERIHRKLFEKQQAEAYKPGADDPVSSTNPNAQIKEPKPAQDPAPILEAPPDEVVEKNETTVYGGAWPKLGFGRDIAFYDPRRPKKYWTGMKAHYNTLGEALESLARQYNVSSQWIENHMGETNVLVEIHQTIREQLSKKK